jgi:Holliday junction resolvase RusA-like endonuclease
MEIHLTIDGKPEGKDRPRFGNGRTFTTKKTLLAEGEIRRAWEQAGKPRLPDGAIEIDVTLVVTRPGGHWKRDGQLSAEGLRNPYPAKQKPDVDNALKLIMDALNTRAWADDVRVVSATVRRIWGEWPRTEFSARSALLADESSSLPSAQEQQLRA